MNTDLTNILRDDIHVAPDHLAPDTSLQDAGIDSLAVVELSVQLSDTLGITVSENDIARAATLGDIDTLVTTELTRSSR
ncbi:acyl carrier protein [Lentzea sp. NPDC042327]|uniref:acyl carrier protein n=1 Tax=Lentzea sp. NPDC042327 TaxID=3154801 RepID=UPI0033E0646A